MKCIYCGNPAGLFSNKHKECEQNHNDAIETIKHSFIDSVSTGATFEEACKVVVNSINNGYVKDDELHKLFSDSLEPALRKRMGNIVDSLYEAAEALDSGHTAGASAGENADVASGEDNADVASEGESADEASAEENADGVSAEESADGASAGENTAGASAEESADGAGSGVDAKTREEIADAIQVKVDAILQSAVDGGLDKKIVDDIKKEAIIAYVNKSLEDSLVSENEQKHFSALLIATNVDSQELSEDENFTKFCQAITLREIQEGKTAGHVNVDGNLPILLGKGENVIWLYKNIRAYESKVGHKFEGGSNGLAFKITKGVYYKVGKSSGHSVEYDYTKELGTGVIILTNKHIYFVGEKSLKIPFNKIVTIEPYSDGIKIQKDGSSSSPVTFVGFDSWFMVNAIQLLVG